MKIPNRFTGSTIYEADVPTMRELAEKAVREGVSLDGASLDGASPDGASLVGGEKLTGYRPVLLIGPLGSRNAYLTIFRTDKGLRVRAGCFFGDAATFLAKVAATHGDRPHGRDYRAAMALAVTVLGEDVPATEPTKGDPPVVLAADGVPNDGRPPAQVLESTVEG